MRLVVLIACTGCNQLFGIQHTHLPDAPPDAVACSGHEFTGNTALGFAGYLDPDYSPLDLWLDRAPAGGKLQLYHATRASTDVPFGPAMAASELASAGQDNDPALTADGLDIVFSSSRNNTGNSQLFEATRADRSQPFSNVHLINELSGVDGRWGHDLSADGRTLYYVDGNQHLFAVQRENIDGLFGAPSSMLATSVAWPTVSPDLHELFYEDPSTGGVYRITRVDTSAAFDSTPVPIDAGAGDPDMSNDPTMLVVDTPSGIVLLTRSCN